MSRRGGRVISIEVHFLRKCSPVTFCDGMLLGKEHNRVIDTGLIR